MVLWAARDIQRYWGRAMLLAASLAGLVFVLATPLLFSQALETTWQRLMQQAPDLVIRRIDAGGWAPMPADESLSRIRTVPGALDPTARIWGVVPGPGGPVTVIASPGHLPANLPDGTPPPETGQAVVGQGVASQLTAQRLTLGGQPTITVDVIGTFPAETGLATHDLVWVAPADARTILGLEPDQVSDVTIRLFHRGEAQAIQADLARAVGWPVNIVDNQSAALSLRSRAAGIGSTALITAIPAMLTLMLVVAGTVVESAGNRIHWGLLKSIGWTTADIVRLHLIKAAMVSLPSVAWGLACAHAAVFHPALAGVTAFWIGGGQHLPVVTLCSAGAARIMLDITALVGLPYLATVYLTTLRGVAAAAGTLPAMDPWT
jgi:hypothetical protein